MAQGLGIHDCFAGSYYHLQRFARLAQPLLILFRVTRLRVPGHKKLVQHQFTSYQTGHESRAVASPARDNSRALTSLMGLVVARFHE